MTSHENDKAKEQASTNPETPPPDRRGDDDATILFTFGSTANPAQGATPPTGAFTIFPAGARLGKYEIRKVIGQGGMGVVYLAHDRLLERDVAIKVLPPEYISNPSMVQRFILEARSAAKLSHPHTVAVYDVGQQEKAYFLVMELVTGGSAEDHLEKQGAYPVYDATRIIADACKGLSAAHAIGLVHRDIKPANLMLALDGTVKIADFGLAKARMAAERRLTQTNTVVGTPYFMSPEQCQSSDVDARSDIYSLGATYYTLLTGAVPYSESSSAMQIMYAHCHAPLPDPRSIDPRIPPACTAVIQKAMAKKPEDRYQNADEMLADLNAVLAGLSGEGIRLPSQSGDQDRTPAMAKDRTRIRMLIAFIGGGVFFVALLAVLSAYMQGWFAGGGLATAGTDPIRIGILHSLQGTMKDSEMPVVDAVLLAVDEINQAGGLLGRKIEYKIGDGQSDPNIFAAEAEKLILDEQVCTIFGCWTSASRKAVLPILEEHDHLLVYPVQYEGVELSPYIVYIGAVPNQQILPAVRWLVNEHKRKRFFLVGSDYIYPRIANEIIEDELKTLGVTLVGEEYLPLGSQDVQPIIEKIKAANSDVILNNINGDSNIAFFRDLRKAGITPDQVPTMSFSIGEVEIRNLNIKQMQGEYAAWTYFQSLDTPENKSFIKRFQAKYGAQRVITDPMVSAYIGVKLWAQAVRDAGSIEPAKIRRAMQGQRLMSAEGPVRIDATTQHTFRRPRIGRVQENGQFKVIWEAKEPVAPVPFPPSRTSEQWRAHLTDLYNRWGKSWEAPEN